MGEVLEKTPAIWCLAARRGVAGRHQCITRASSIVSRRGVAFSFFFSYLFSKTFLFFFPFFSSCCLINDLFLFASVINCKCPCCIKSPAMSNEISKSLGEVWLYSLGEAWTLPFSVHNNKSTCTAQAL